MNLIWFISSLIIAIAICISPVCAIEHDGVLKYDTSDSGQITGFYGMTPWGHAVFFKNKATITVTGIQLEGCKYGPKGVPNTVTIEIWDKNLKQLYQDSVSYDQVSMGHMDITQNNCAQVASLADVPLPNHVVTGDFYVVVFTHSPKPSSTSKGMNIGFTTTSTTGTSHTVLENPNKFDDLKIQGQYSTAAIDWIIRVLYTNSTTTTTSTPIQSMNPQNIQTITTTSTTVSSLPVDQISVTPSAAETTKANIDISLVVIGIVISMFIWKRL